MGRDKALILIDGEPLWARQLRVLRETDPAELLISAGNRTVFRDAPCPVIPDAEPGHGPLGGIATLLEVMQDDWLLVLAVDLPRMTSEFLRQVLHGTLEAGRVCVHPDGKLEPLVAVYPRAALPIAQEQLRSGDRKLSSFIQRLEGEGLITRRLIAPAELPLFTNWNAPADVEPDGLAAHDSTRAIPPGAP